MPTWTPLQLQCLEVLNVPIMAFVKPTVDSIAVTQQASQTKPQAITSQTTKTVRQNLHVATAPNDNSTDSESYFYRLGPWFFQSSTQLPVSGIPWISDLAAYANTRLSQISDVADAFCIDPYLKSPLSPEQKRELWEALKARLKQR